MFSIIKEVNENQCEMRTKSKKSNDIFSVPEMHKSGYIMH